MIKVAIMGTGGISEAHIKAYLRFPGRCRITALADIFPDKAREAEGDQVYLVDRRDEQRLPVRGRVGFPFFGQLILDCLNRTENAMTQEHAFKAIELAILAENQAERIT